MLLLNKSIVQFNLGRNTRRGVQLTTSKHPSLKQLTRIVRKIIMTGCHYSVSIYIYVFCSVLVM